MSEKTNNLKKQLDEIAWQISCIKIHINTGIVDATMVIAHLNVVGDLAHAKAEELRVKFYKKGENK